MGDGKTTRLATSSSAPRVTASRNSRFKTRASIRSFKAVERAPIILELSPAVMRFGYAEECKPQHIIPMTTDNERHLQKSETQWYSILGPLMQQVYDRLMCNPTSRRVVLLHSHSQYPPTTWQAALSKILWNKGVPALVFFSSLELVPVAQGWKRGLIVQVTREEAVCVCHADGHVLPFTYQSVPNCGYKHLMKDETMVQREWTKRMELQLLDENNPDSLVVALLKCLEACPRDIRFYVISNIVICGEGLMLLPDLGRRVGKRLQDILAGTATPLEKLEDSTAAVTVNLTMVPVLITPLRPLADHLGILSCAPHRPDWISWVGASLWAATWNKYDDEESRIQWTIAPEE
jgi:hypothetical protein